MAVQAPHMMIQHRLGFSSILFLLSSPDSIPSLLSLGWGPFRRDSESSNPLLLSIPGEKRRGTDSNLNISQRQLKTRNNGNEFDGESSHLERNIFFKSFTSYSLIEINSGSFGCFLLLLIQVDEWCSFSGSSVTGVCRNTDEFAIDLDKGDFPCLNWKKGEGIQGPRTSCNMVIPVPIQVFLPIDFWVSTI
ncbi:hypothetical protein Ccrd_025614 [Cynara cardunculus var. scolymus]|uniref:Uncharacterized protein n=1 Tax=Cynara cardunculus var. scolymus TaxID=59895 RepID=A0A103W9W7_CYNCS|nr:hypothetical protein Ccrd_025614 [Cynara cardunculus var. scolymus]